MIDFVQPDYTFTFIALAASVVIAASSSVFFVIKWAGTGFITLVVGLLLVLISSLIPTLRAQDDASLKNIGQVESYLENKYEGDFTVEAHNPRQFLRSGEYMKTPLDFALFDVTVVMNGSDYSYELESDNGRPVLGDPLRSLSSEPAPELTEK